MKRGYKPACDSHNTSRLLAETKALAELAKEVCQQIRKLPTRRISRAELKRDFGCSDSGLRLLEALGWLRASSNGAGRKMYDLHTALAISLFFPGFAQAPRIRTERKYDGVLTVAQEAVERILRRGAEAEAV